MSFHVGSSSTKTMRNCFMIGGGSFSVSFASPQRHLYHFRLRRNDSPKARTGIRVQCKGAKVVLTKQGHRFLSSLVASAGDSLSANRLIRKFVAASPKSVVLNVLTYLLSPRTSYPNLSAVVFSLYSEMAEASWFEWNPKLVANIIALLNKQGRYIESETLLSLALSKLRSRERELALFYCNLIEANSKHGSSQGFDWSYECLSDIIRSSSSIYVRRQGYRSMVGAFCEMEQPHTAEKIIEKMRTEKLQPSLYEYRCTLYGYGRLGLFEDMERILHKMGMEGMKIDTVCSNMVLSSYGSHNVLPDIGSWLIKMKKSNIPFSVRTYNSVLNSCPTVMAALEDLNSCPLSVSELIKILNRDEASVVMELVQSPVLEEAMKWNDSEAKLDLHGMHVSSAYLIMLQWKDETRSRLMDGDRVIPAEIVVICGSGKHSSVRGDSPVKALVKSLMVRTKSPMRINRKNVGCFTAKTKAVKNWLGLP